jgi:hypothetical protein
VEKEEEPGLSKPAAGVMRLPHVFLIFFRGEWIAQGSVLPAKGHSASPSSCIVCEMALATRRQAGATGSRRSEKKESYPAPAFCAAIGMAL